MDDDPLGAAIGQPEVLVVREVGGFSDAAAVDPGINVRPGLGDDRERGQGQQDAGPGRAATLPAAAVHTPARGPAAVALTAVGAPRLQPADLTQVVHPQSPRITLPCPGLYATGHTVYTGPRLHHSCPPGRLTGGRLPLSFEGWLGSTWGRQRRR